MNTDYTFMYEATSGSCSTGGVDDYVYGGAGYSAARLVDAEASLDYALIKMEGNPVSSYGYLDIEDVDAEIGDKIYIPQHPYGRDKSIAIYDDYSDGAKCSVMENSFSCGADCSDSCDYDSHPDTRYQCDTEGGSSGSPVLSSSTHKVVALHHCGLSDCGGNLGVPMSKVYSRIGKIVYEGSTQSPSTSPEQCVDDPTFTYLDGFTGATCAWFAENPSYNCRKWGSWTDEDGDSANESCCACIELTDDNDTSRPTPSPTALPTHNPTAQPSSMPSPSPTQVPSPSPSTFPSPVPTLIVDGVYNNNNDDFDDGSGIKGDSNNALVVGLGVSGGLLILAFSTVVCFVCLCRRKRKDKGRGVIDKADEEIPAAGTMDSSSEVTPTTKTIVSTSEEITILPDGQIVTKKTTVYSDGSTVMHQVFEEKLADDAVLSA